MNTALRVSEDMRKELVRLTSVLSSISDKLDILIAERGRAQKEENDSGKEDE